MLLTVFVMLDAKTLLKLPVYTKSGTHLGKVAGFEFEQESQMIVRWRVRPKGVAAQLVGGELAIGREQVISITDEKMTVDDGVQKEMELARAKDMGLVGETA